MTTGRYSRRQLKKKASTSSVPASSGPLSMGAVLGASLVLHLAVGLIVMSGIHVGRFERAPIVTMSVDLVSAPPVVAPKRGAGGAVAVKESPSPANKPVAVKESPTPANKPVAPVVKRQEVLVPTRNKKTLKPEKKSAVNEENDIRKSLAAMRQRQQDKKAQDDTADTIAQMRKAQADKAKAASAVKPVAGTSDGIGTEAGGAIADWARAGLQSKWNLSKYQLTSFDLVTKVVIEYDKSGKMVRFELKSRSGNKVFDDSILKALKAFSEERVPTSYTKNLKGSFSQEFTLTPKDLQD